MAAGAIRLVKRLTRRIIRLPRLSSPGLLANHGSGAEHPRRLIGIDVQDSGSWIKGRPAPLRAAVPSGIFDTPLGRRGIPHIVGFQSPKPRQELLIGFLGY